MRKPPNDTPSDLGESKPLDRSPRRKCIISGESHPQEELVRLAISLDDQIAPDVRAKAPGRGAWIGVDRLALDAAQASGQLKAALSRAFKSGKVEIADDLGAKVEIALRQASLDRLGLEARGGTLLTGSEKIETAARQGTMALLLHASDAGRDGCAKLDQAWRVGNDRQGEDMRGMILPVDRQVLSVALGRQNVVHIGIIDARAAGRISQMLRRWLHFIGSDKVADDAKKKTA